jgi:hypothetical protein
LAADLKRHSWLGQFWQSDEPFVRHLSGPLTVEAISTLSHRPQIAAFYAESASSVGLIAPLTIPLNSKAICFTADELPEDGLETIRQHLLDKLGHLDPQHPTARHLPDPMGIDYPTQITFN